MPVKPPMPNIGIQAEANSIGTGNRIDPRQSDKSRALKIMTDGTEMRTVVNEKNELTTSPIPVRNMWWAQRRKAYTENRKNHPPVTVERFASSVCHDLGNDPHRWQDQHVNLRVDQKPKQVLPYSGLPPPATSICWPFTTRPDGK